MGLCVSVRSWHSVVWCEVPVGYLTAKVSINVRRACGSVKLCGTIFSIAYYTDKVFTQQKADLVMEVKKHVALFDGM